MIFVEMAGRHGNQFFHYAVARYVQLKTGDDDLVLNYNSVFKKNRQSEGWYDVLQEYKTVPYSYYGKEGTVIVNESSLIQKLIIALKSLHIKFYQNKTRQKRADKAGFMQGVLNRMGIYWIREGVNHIKVYPRDRSIVTGPCETSFIYEIQDVLQDELTPKNEVMEQNKELLETILSSDSVCISVRRGDFFNTKFQKSFGVCTPEYYIKAKKLMDAQLITKRKPQYFIFSDDIEWCKENINIPGGVYVPQNMPVYETLRLMYSCKHFILSNSTFSWWGQFLSKNKDKVVVSPSRWNNDGYDSVLISKDWFLIDC